LKQAARLSISLIPPQLRRPPGVVSRTGFLDNSQWWSKDRLEEYQLSKLNEILLWTAVRIPHYRALKVRDLLPLQGLDDIRAWPIVDRRTIAADPDSFVAGTFPTYRIRKGSTTGRSGTPLTVRWEWPSALWWEQAFLARTFRWAGLRPGFRRTVLRGNLVHGPKGVESRSYQVLPHTRTLVLSTFQLDADNVREYVGLMRRFRTDALQAYPSSAARLAKLAQEEGVPLPPLKAVLTSSEMVTPQMRRTIESVLEAPVYDLYGHAERSVAAANCHARKDYHIFQEYGYVEILLPGGQPAQTGCEGEIVATGFNNRAMPFIRYRTGDYAELSTTSCECGRGLATIRRLCGRESDYLIDRQGERVSMRLGLGPSELRRVSEMRFIQEERGVAELIYVGSGEPEDEKDLLFSLTQRIGDRVTFSVKRVERMPMCPDGKAVLVQRKITDGSTQS